MVILVLGLLLVEQRPPTSAARQNCVEFSSNGRLDSGKSFVTKLPLGLELTLEEDGDAGWDIRVGRPEDSGYDYVWVVTPPFQTAPHRKIGPGYGRTARESVAIERKLSFVLNDTDYAAALDVVRGIRAISASPERIAELNRLAKGNLTIKVTKFGLRKAADEHNFDEALDWIELTGEACVPR
jgi:hypothetical protein